MSGYGTGGQQNGHTGQHQLQYSDDVNLSEQNAQKLTQNLGASQKNIENVFKYEKMILYAVIALLAIFIFVTLAIVADTNRRQNSLEDKLLIAGNTKSTIENLDNRPRWMGGNIRDDTGATNPAGMLGNGYGVQMSGAGNANVLQDQYRFGYGRSAYLDKGQVQTEYSGLRALEQQGPSPPSPRPLYQPLQQQQAQAPVSTENYQSKSFRTQSPDKTDMALRNHLINL